MLFSVLLQQHTSCRCPVNLTGFIGDNVTSHVQWLKYNGTIVKQSPAVHAFSEYLWTNKLALNRNLRFFLNFWFSLICFRFRDIFFSFYYFLYFGFTFPQVSVVSCLSNRVVVVIVSNSKFISPTMFEIEKIMGIWLTIQLGGMWHTLAFPLCALLRGWGQLGIRSHLNIGTPCLPELVWLLSGKYCAKFWICWNEN